MYVASHLISSPAQSQRKASFTDKYLNGIAKDTHALAAQLSLLTTIPTIITRILRAKGPLLLASKLLLLSRLVHKTLSSHAEAPPLIDTLRDRLASLRAKLLRAIDKRFADPERETGLLVEDMCAFALATASTPSEVLSHFLKIRLRALQWHLSHDSVEVGEDGGMGTKEHAIKAMELLLTSLRHSTTIFPKRLSDALLRLKDAPLIRQRDVLAVHELRLTVHARHLTDELRNYTPQPRHDELFKADAEKILKSWAKSAQKAFVAGLKMSLGRVGNFDEVLEVRQRLFETWPWSGRSLVGLHSADVVDEMRDVVNARLSALIESDVRSLGGVCTLTTELLSSSLDGMQQPSLWSSALTDLDANAGGDAYKSAVLRAYHGIDASSSRPILAFESWIQKIQRIQTDLKRMKDTHWDDDDLGDSDDNDENEEDVDSKQTLLAEDDPRTLSDVLSTALSTASFQLMKDFESLVSRLAADPGGEPPDDVRPLTTLIRILREISKRAAAQDETIASILRPLAILQHVPGTGDGDESSEPVSANRIIPPLLTPIGASITQKLIAHLWKSLPRFQASPVLIGRELWEVKPGGMAIPVLPSVHTFKLMRLVTRGMESVGVDLWSPIAVQMLKSAVRTVVAREFGQVVDALMTQGTKKQDAREVEEGKTEVEEQIDEVVKDTEAPFKEKQVAAVVGSADVGEDEREQLRRDKLVQISFDLFYLDAAFNIKSQVLGADTNQENLLAAVVERAVKGAELEEKQLERLGKAARAYWGRTYLLFGLLAG